MREASAERKLQVVKQIREEQTRNQQLIRGREHILYGVRSSGPIYQNDTFYSDTDAEPLLIGKGNLSFKVRFAVSVLLLLSIILFDKAQVNLFQYTVSDIFTYLETDLTKDFQANLFDFTLDIPYTTK